MKPTTIHPPPLNTLTLGDRGLGGIAYCIPPFQHSCFFFPDTPFFGWSLSAITNRAGLIGLHCTKAVICVPMARTTLTRRLWRDNRTDGREPSRVANGTLPLDLVWGAPLHNGLMKSNLYGMIFAKYGKM